MTEERIIGPNGETWQEPPPNSPVQMKPGGLDLFSGRAGGYVRDDEERMKQNFGSVQLMLTFLPQQSTPFHGAGARLHMGLCQCGHYTACGAQITTGDPAD
jgi:hypothetical protein